MHTPVTAVRLQDMIKLAGFAKLMRPLQLAFAAESRSLKHRALQTLDCWADSLNPTFLEPKLKAHPGLLFAGTSCTSFARCTAQSTCCAQFIESSQLCRAPQVQEDAESQAVLHSASVLRMQCQESLLCQC